MTRPRVGKSPGDAHYTDPRSLLLTHMAALLDQGPNPWGPVVFHWHGAGDAGADAPLRRCCFYSHADQRQYRDITQQACQQRQIPYLDVLDLWAGGGGMPGGDRAYLGMALHPNVAGYRSLLADVTAWSAFQSLL
jgi:hypothetical protein